jgi:hypothetical protein
LRGCVGECGVGDAEVAAEDGELGKENVRFRPRASLLKPAIYLFSTEHLLTTLAKVPVGGGPYTKRRRGRDFPGGIMSKHLTVYGLVLLLASACGDDGKARGAARSFLHNSSWPVPTADTWRSSSVSSGGLPADVRSEDLVAEPVELGPVPFFAITYSDDTVFVLGGTPFLLELFTLAQGNTPPDRNLSTLVDLVKGFVENELVDPYVAKIRTPSTDVLPPGVSAKAARSRTYG